MCVCVSLIISERKPAADAGLACFHLVVQSLKEAFKTLYTDTARHWQGIRKGSTSYLEHSGNNQKWSTLHSYPHIQVAVSVGRSVPETLRNLRKRYYKEYYLKKKKESVRLKEMAQQLRELLHL